MQADKPHRYTARILTVGTFMKRRIARVSLLLLAAVALAACGTKGALVLPDQQAAAKKKSTATLPPAAPAEPAKQ